MNISSLPNGYQARHPTTDDLDALAALLIAHERAHAGKASWQPPAAREWIETVWATTDFEVARDARVIVAPSGEIVGYVTLWRADEAAGFFVASPSIAPEYESLGLAVALLRWAETLARQKAAALPASVRATLSSYVDGPDPATEALLTQEGLTLAQRYLRMEITLREPPPDPEWSVGVAVRPWVAGQDERAVYDLMNLAFAASPEYEPLAFDEWLREVVEPERSDPALWTLACASDAGEDGDHSERLVGAVINRIDAGDDGDIGWLEDVGVDPAWRGRGLGLALVYHSLGMFYRRGVTRCGLSVDAHNASGATRLYARAGMTPQPHQVLRYAKPLR